MTETIFQIRNAKVHCSFEGSHCYKKEDIIENFKAFWARIHPDHSHDEINIYLINKNYEIFVCIADLASKQYDNLGLALISEYKTDNGITIDHDNALIVNDDLISTKTSLIFGGGFWKSSNRTYQYYLEFRKELDKARQMRIDLEKFKELYLNSGLNIQLFNFPCLRWGNDWNWYLDDIPIKDNYQLALIKMLLKAFNASYHLHKCNSTVDIYDSYCPTKNYSQKDENLFGYALEFLCSNLRVSKMIDDSVITYLHNAVNDLNSLPGMENYVQELNMIISNLSYKASVIL